jgi:hypothetical protein
MKQSTIDKMRRQSQLITPTGAVMVRQLLDEVERLQEAEYSKKLVKLLLLEIQHLGEKLNAHNQTTD